MKKGTLSAGSQDEPRDRTGESKRVYVPTPDDLFQELGREAKDRRCTRGQVILHRLSTAPAPPPVACATFPALASLHGRLDEMRGLMREVLGGVLATADQRPSLVEDLHQLERIDQLLTRISEQLDVPTGFDDA